MIDLRPQPIGIYPPPAANLVLPAVDDDHGALQELLRGDLNVRVPGAWRFFVAAARGEIVFAMELMTDQPSPLATYNRFVLAPDEQTFGNIRRSLPDDLASLLDVAAYSAGVIDSLEEPFQLDGELLALALATQAAAAMERQDATGARSALKAAVAEARDHSSLLASTLLSQLADLSVWAPGQSTAHAILQVREAIELAGDCKLPMLLAELYTKLGMLYQNAANGQRGALLEAVNAYQAALQRGVTQADHPEQFAQLQNNLGLAYLSMPSAESSSQLRSGIAVQSFRHALKVYTIEQHAERWASVSMNLANALQYVPSSHPQENLIQAVEIYEAVLQVRSRAKDPVAYATVLLNQSNALAHLGIFGPALEKLSEAYKLFHWYEQIEKANAAQNLVEQINQRMSARNQPQETSTN